MVNFYYVKVFSIYGRETCSWLSIIRFQQLGIHKIKLASKF